MTKPLCLKETAYSFSKDALNATLYTTGNGYMGVRGSFEEYSTLGVQGTYIRGYLDEAVEICAPVPDSVYMKKYYYDEEGLKRFEKSEFGVNVLDILTARIEIDGEPFYMHEGTLLDYERTLDFESGILTRRVRWENTKGDVTDILFERFSSFADDHLYCQRITVEPINHAKKIAIIAGIDPRTKTNGQYITSVQESEISKNTLSVSVESGKKYGFLCRAKASVFVCADGKSVDSFAPYKKDGVLAVRCETVAKKVVAEKFTLLYTSRDCVEDCAEVLEKRDASLEKNYDKQLAAHLNVYEKLFANGNIWIDGDDGMATAMAFSCYQSLISVNRNDGLHGVAAKGLTGEGYHQFVWWDSEIYQMPYFLYVAPEAARHTLEYRYSMMEQAKKNAADKGYDGARFAFCSGIKGDELVWSFVRHPFMQDHIVSDVAYAVLNYYFVTLDEKFMREKGFDMLFQCLRYWVSRVTETSRGYEILRCTGTDEHHPYVNNDAYTNYTVKFVAEKAVEEYRAHNDFPFEKIGVTAELIERIAALAEKMYLPEDKFGMIPQFDGYFSLKRGIDGTENSTRAAQMKFKGAYHESQIIKQPDVMLLYTYLNVGMNDAFYARNFDYYEKMCECSSSLSYAPHAVACADLDRLLGFYEYLEKTANIDLCNLHGGSTEGVHSGCAAGAWYSVFRGLFGIRCFKDGICFNPKQIPWWKKVFLNFYYRNSLIKVEICDNIIYISKEDDARIPVTLKGVEYVLEKELRMDISSK